MNIVKILILVVVMCGVVKAEQKSLQFSGTSSYIMFTKDMAEVQDAVSVCTWYKKQKDGRGILLTYVAEGQFDAITMSDDLEWNHVVRTNPSYSGEAIARDVWYHTCLTWSRSSRTVKRYLNGKKVAEVTHSGDRYIVNGSPITIGEKHSTPTNQATFQSPGYAFIGEMTKFFIFKKCLNDGEVSELYDDGLCGTKRMDDYFSESLFVTWDYILNESPKGGQISPIDLGCEDPTEPQPTESQPTASQPTASQPTEPQSTEPQSTEPQPTEPQPTIGNETEMSEPTAEIEDECKSHWDILYSEDFFNKTVTDGIIDKLVEPWKILFEFQGHVIDEALVNHLRRHHSCQESGCSDLA